ncbi:hypothetical protein CSN84_003893 [Salmonella enterica subsp. diarizonae]|nr:hypothetical protein [Salmonella enterica subsp. diarizonae]
MNFPEVYHGEGISEALFSVPAGRVTGQGWTQHKVCRVPFGHRIWCVMAPSGPVCERISCSTFFRI